ncbi:winged helix-turn-helix transcriptional regulator [Pontivivens ytuae]|uniref:Helix-turn-helix transcriptional regulator n=1 Tax=Pontivivens ytuae TaxID=2789856 RepID=A0A7S9LSB4_9RHOB|nr:helix-turn-helix domain-containing protein [Pontivivens ytuae]QPH53805.1 helix-turn-helix transcriptional regulator [Pontivivens ytuae]
MSNVTKTDELARAPALEQIGDRWTLLIIWASLNGISRFDDYQRQLGVARNILSTRLRRLVEMGILVKKPVHEGARRLEYRVTEKGRELRPALEEIEHWGSRWR